MTWVDFLSDFVQILTAIMDIPLFSFDNGLGALSISLGQLLVGFLVFISIAFYFIPRK